MIVHCYALALYIFTLVCRSIPTPEALSTKRVLMKGDVKFVENRSGVLWRS